MPCSRMPASNWSRSGCCGGGRVRDSAGRPVARKKASQVPGMSRVAIQAVSDSTPAYVSSRASIAERVRNSAGGTPYSPRNARLKCAALKNPQCAPIAATGR